MRTIFAALFVISALYLSSCKDKDTNLFAVPKQDTTSNMGFMNLSFAGKTFHVVHMTADNSPIHSLIALTKSFDKQDTLWIGQIQVTDHKQKMISMDLTVYNASSGAAVGTYVVRTNNCTVTDFSEGKNRVYAVGAGSYVDITAAGFTTTGTLNLNLYYNKESYNATGNFTIYRY